MIELVDTHAHLDGLTADGSTTVLDSLQRAADAGVLMVIAVGGHPEGNRFALDMAASHPSRLRAAIGYDRYTAHLEEASLPPLSPQLCLPTVVALGEIGLDFYHSPETAVRQIERFESMLALARRFQLPVLVHCRESEPAMRPLLERHAAEWPGVPDRIGVIHCYTGTIAFAEFAVSLGFSISYSGILTFPKAENVRASARIVPLDRLLVETDTPYLAPVPLRGKRNEPAFLPAIVRELARLRNLSYEEMAYQTSANARRIFAVPAVSPLCPTAAAPVPP